MFEASSLDSQQTLHASESLWHSWSFATEAPGHGEFHGTFDNALFEIYFMELVEGRSPLKHQ
jgi:hypothetical protein